MLAAFGDAVRRLRTERRLSQERLAEEAGIHRTYIGDVERGRRNVSLVNIVRIADALSIDTASLMRRWIACGGRTRSIPRRHRAGAPLAQCERRPVVGLPRTGPAGTTTRTRHLLNPKPIPSNLLTRLGQSSSGRGVVQAATGGRDCAGRGRVLSHNPPVLIPPVALVGRSWREAHAGLRLEGLPGNLLTGGGKHALRAGFPKHAAARFMDRSVTELLRAGGHPPRRWEAPVDSVYADAHHLQTVGMASLAGSK